MSDTIAEMTEELAAEIADAFCAKPRALPIFRETLREILSQDSQSLLQHNGDCVEVLASTFGREFGTKDAAFSDDDLSLSEFNTIDADDLEASRRTLIESVRLHTALKREHMAGNEPDELSIRHIVRLELGRRNQRAKEMFAAAGVRPKERHQLTARQRELLDKYLPELKKNAESFALHEAIDLVGVVFPSNISMCGAVLPRGRMIRILGDIGGDVRQAIAAISPDNAFARCPNLNDLHVVIFTDEIVEHDNGDRIFKLPHLPVVTSIKVGEVAS